MRLCLRSFSVRSKTEEAKADRPRTDGSLRDISPPLLNLLNLGLPKEMQARICGCRSRPSKFNQNSTHKDLPQWEALWFDSPLSSYRERRDLRASGSRSSMIRARSAASPPRYDGAGVAISTSARAIKEKISPATPAEISMW